MQWRILGLPIDRIETLGWPHTFLAALLFALAGLPGTGLAEAPAEADALEPASLGEAPAKTPAPTDAPSNESGAGDLEATDENLPPKTPAETQSDALEELIDDSGDTSLGDPVAAPPSLDDPVLAPPDDWEDQADIPRHHLRNSCRQLHPDEREDFDKEAVDWAREQIEETVCSASLWFDGLFGDDRNLDAARGAYGRLETSYEYSEFYGAKTRTRFRLRVDLPNLQDRASVFVGRDNDDNFVSDRSEGFALRSEFPEIDDRDKFFAGFGYGLPSNRRFRSDVKVGVRSLTNTRAFVQWRAEYLAYVDDVNLVQFRLTPFYSTRDGFGVTPGVDYSRVLTPRLLARWSNVGTHSDTTLGFDWRSALVLYQGFGWQRGLAYEAFIRGVTETPVKLREYGLRLVYRQPIVGGRLYLQPLVGYSWPKELPGIKREGAYLVGVGLELPYGKDPRRAIAFENESRTETLGTEADKLIEGSEPPGPATPNEMDDQPQVEDEAGSEPGEAPTDTDTGPETQVSPVPVEPGDMPAPPASE
jgi:hypothetical protein